MGAKDGTLFEIIPLRMIHPSHSSMQPTPMRCMGALYRTFVFTQTLVHVITLLLVQIRGLDDSLSDCHGYHLPQSTLTHNMYIYMPPIRVEARVPTLMGFTGLSPTSDLAWLILVTISLPSITWPKTGWRLSVETSNQSRKEL
eukprot:COSAG01_NODE_9626_length_2385_cov_1.969816_4_plen_143_part_00